jgi:hypothetical protein
MKLHSFLPKFALATLACVLLIGSSQLYAETANAAAPSTSADLNVNTTPLPQPGPWLLVAGAVALCVSRVRWRGKRPVA